MGCFYIETERLVITEFNKDMIESVHVNSLDEDNRHFVPDEVFETVEEAAETVLFLMSCYKGNTGPFVYPILLKSGGNIGYVQTVSMENGWEIGYHIAKNHTGIGYATEAVKSFLPIIMDQLNIEEMHGICVLENVASSAVMEKCGFVLEYKGMDNYQGKARNICRYLYSRSILICEME